MEANHDPRTQFTAVQGVTLSPMFFLNPAILSRAGLYTVGALGTSFAFPRSTPAAHSTLLQAAFATSEPLRTANSSCTSADLFSQV